MSPPSPLPPLQQHSSSSIVPITDPGSTVAIVSCLPTAPSPLPMPLPPTGGLPPLRRAPPRHQPQPSVAKSSHRQNAAPRKQRRKRSLCVLSTPITTTGAQAANPKPKPSSVKKKEQQEEQEVEVELECPTVPDIPSLPPIMAEHAPLEGLGCEVLVGSVDYPSLKRLYKPRSKLTEGKCPLYGIGFNFLDARYYDTFATVGGNRVTTYRCLENGSFALLQAYIDEDKDESFYTLSWACDDVDSAPPLLVVGGCSGIIRVINCATEKIAKSLVGHGGSINEIRTQALKPSLIISASKDESVRLWNVHTGICILVFAGAGGHRNDVLSVDFHPNDITCFASCGMDNTVKIWSMKEFWVYVEKSYSWTDLQSKFPTKYVQLPVLNAVVHSDYVDCTRWLGDFILSKSVEHEIVLWEPKIKENSPGEGSIDILQKYPVPKCDNWFIKFSCDFHFNQLAIGNCEGAIYLWEVQSSPPVLTARLYNEQCKSLIRQTAVSFDGSTILGAGEDGNIWRWDEVDQHSVNEKKQVETRHRRRHRRCRD
ncbi:hypothetical protein PAHAL_6G076500 [Panicum hallii]|uniref:Uncharacterized protein n=1 Tax=Panicum hallii TaxID=206008 RepID=A0A2S3I1W6_9POAL|nr:hypothetical protein PAHAL_6G076500 [Panicum hallii]